MAPAECPPVAGGGRTRMSIKPLDTVRKAADLTAPDLEGVEGKWLDVPRLQQLNGETQSSYWCGRTSAAMIYNFFKKFEGKTDEYVGHEKGDKGPGTNEQEYNLRFLGRGGK